MTSPRTILYYFTLQSPWAFLGHARLLDIAHRHGAALDYRPMSLAEVFPASGGLPLAKRHPNRQAYRMVELKRWIAKLGLTMNEQPAFWPLDVAAADRTVIALTSMGLDPEPFVSRAFAGIWQGQRNLAAPDTIAAILGESGQEADAVLAQADATATRERYRDNAAEALSRSVFGSPTYLLDGEPFWGQDRLDMVDEALTSGRAPIRP